ncbi:MAG: hypothetical protein JXR37_15150 [Kiritimatiellae bacterium]|nr:hypothetical protein [Kiritimatiellia bacterium]
MSPHNTAIVADTHLHLYSCFDLCAAFRSLASRLQRLSARLSPGAAAAEGASPIVQLGFLAERRGCDFFARLKEQPGPLLVGRCEVKPGPESACLVVQVPEGAPLYLFAGRQIVTRERIEVLALATEEQIPDGEPLADSVRRAADSGVAVLAWAPGKWFFRRGRCVRNALDSVPPTRLLIGDSTLRPRLWPTPRLTRYAVARGFRVVAGSDPLPAAAEEGYMGSYATILNGPFEPERPVSSARSLLLDPTIVPRAVGRRSSSAEILFRLARSRKGR